MSILHFIESITPHKRRVFRTMAETYIPPIWFRALTDIWGYAPYVRARSKQRASQDQKNIRAVRPRTSIEEAVQFAGDRQIYLKKRGPEPTASKLNTVLASGFWQKISADKIIAETGAGPAWCRIGNSSSFFGMECDITWAR
jgi:tryptophan synthase beta subunit